MYPHPHLPHLFRQKHRRVGSATTSFQSILLSAEDYERTNLRWSFMDLYPNSANPEMLRKVILGAPAEYEILRNLKNNYSWPDWLTLTGLICF